MSPLLSNVYLNDFDWYVGRKYMEPHRKCKHKCNDTRRLKWAGVTPKYNFRYADDWVLLTSTEQEALRMKRELTKYFHVKMKLELSQEKTKITDLRKDGIHFLGFVDALVFTDPKGYRFLLPAWLTLDLRGQLETCDAMDYLPLALCECTG